MKRRKCVLPGDEVAVVEEFIPGEGTYEIDGKIFSAYCGDLELDYEEKIAKVSARNPPVTLKVGDVVYAEVTDVRNSMAICEVIAVEGKERDISGDTSATIHISKVSSGYTQDVGKELRPSDIIRAKVIQVKPSLQLSTVGHHFGVILALCKKCRAPLKKRNRTLYCERCERTDVRKLADDYGEVKF
ncbi:MAG: exosome complex RNA-binding protein Csl4 [Methanomassiliicoccales archaeon]|jgi:exosome complex component CSL4|nr:exosome complex RNA-binding protein Csl4 [Methanomassiliicoccales archaeon]